MDGSQTPLGPPVGQVSHQLQSAGHSGLGEIVPLIERWLGVSNTFASLRLLVLKVHLSEVKRIKIRSRPERRLIANFSRAQHSKGILFFICTIS